MTTNDKKEEIEVSAQEELNYKKSGVDVEAGYELVQKIKPFVEKTKRPEILSGLGSFSALSRIPKHIENPILVTCTDGVGTKIEIARELNNFETIGIDLVAMCVNDLLVCGAEPLVFLDYYVTDKLNIETASKVIEGIANGCEQARCSLVGGETAEHPGSFPENSFDLAGFSLGVVDENEIIGVEGPKNEDILIGIESSGFHSNGFSLLRKIINDFDVDLLTKIEDENLGEILLKPTHIYVSEILSLKKIVNINAISHITGGGFNENIPRMLGKNQQAIIDHNFQDWPFGHYFEWLMKVTNMPKENLLNTFNCGVGLIISVNKSDEESVLGALNKKFFAKTIGEVKERERNDQQIIFV